MKLLQIKNLDISLREGGKDVLLVNDLNLSVSPGEVHGLVGESGCGKSITALAIMGLLDKPLAVTGGKIIFNGENITKLPPEALRRLRGNKIGMIFQNPMSSFNPLINVYSHFSDSLQASVKLSHQEVHAIVCHWLGKVNLPTDHSFLSKYPFQLSGGMLQRLMIAIVLSKKPALVIADEPTTALDVLTQAEILKLLKELQRELEISVLLISHDFSVVGRLANRISVMHLGKIVEHGPADRLLDSPVHLYTKSLLDSVINCGE